MSHFFSFLYQGIHNQTRQLLVVLLMSTLSTHRHWVVFGVTFSDVFSATYRRLLAPLNGVQYTIYNDVRATYRRPYGDT